MITKIKINSTPQLSKNYRLDINLVNRETTYHCAHDEKLEVKKQPIQVFEQMQQLVASIEKLRDGHYKNAIAMNGFYWEIDLINDNNEMVEIEGVNSIDEKVISIFKTIEETCGYSLGSGEYVSK